MSANTAASLGFGVVGAMFLGPAGFALGATLGGALFPPQLPDIKQQKLSPLNAPNASYGNPIPIVYGTVRTSTTLMWWSGRKTTKHKEESGGKGGPSQSTTYYTYSLDGAFAICEGEITGVRRIWINSRLMYDSQSAENSLNINGSNKLADAVNIYTGSETQEPSSLQESYKGTGNVPAYRGLAYIEFEDLQLEQFGNGLVNVEVEVTRAGASDSPPNILHTTESNWSGKILTSVGGLGGMVMEEGSIISMADIDVAANDDDIDVTIVRCDLQWNLLESRKYPVRMANKTSGVVFGICQNDPYFFFCGRNQEGGGGTDGYLYWFRYPGTGTGLNALGSYRVDYADYPIDQGNGPFGVDDHDLYGNNANRYKTIKCGNHYITMTEKSSGKDVMIAYKTNPYYDSPTLVFDGGIDFLENAEWNVTASAILCDAEIFPDQDNPDEYFFVVVRFDKPSDHDRSVVLMDKDLNVISSWSNADTGSRNGHMESGAVLLSTEGKFLYKNQSTSGLITLVEFDPWTSGSQWALAGTVTVNNDLSYPSILPISNRWVMTRQELVTIEAITSTSYATVADIVTDQCVRAGLASAQVDTTDLSKNVEGYLINQAITARTAIETITPVGFFDVAEVGGQLICTERGGAASKTIPQDDLAAGVNKEERDDLVITRTGELELPREVSVTYYNKNDLYEQNTQKAERLTVQGVGASHAQMPVVMDDDIGMNIADAMLYSFYSERENAEFSVGTKHIDIAPNDIVIVGDDGYRIRVSDVTNNLVGPIKVTGIVESIAAVYSTVRDTAYVSTTSEVTTFRGPTIFALVDVPMLRSVDDVFGYYVCAYGVFDSWNGANLYHSNDNTTYSEVDTFTIESDFGYVSSQVTTTTFNGTWDSSLELRVRMPSSTIVLNSDTEANVLEGANAALVGTLNGVWEVIQWVNASAVGDGEYSLTKLLRGRRGTEYAMNQHSDFPYFIPIDDQGTVKFIQDDIEHLDTQIFYKGVTVGNYIQNANPLVFTNTGRNMMPRAPVVIRGTRDSNNQVNFTWVPVSRNENTPTYVYVSSDPDNYEIDFYDSASTLLRTASATEASVAYASADRVADGASANELITCNIFQISDTVGRGFPGIGQV